MLAAELSIGRNTATQVYEQLAIKGYVSTTTGRGTFVIDSAPDEILIDDPPPSAGRQSNVQAKLLRAAPN